MSIDTCTPATAQPRIAASNQRLAPGHRRLMLAIVILPVLGSVWALYDLATRGISALDLTLLVTLYLLTGFGIEFGYHRALSHRAVQTGRALEIVFAVLGAMAGQGRLLYWVANHRRHHMHSDTMDDPHSPHMKRDADGDHALGWLSGFWHAHVGWVFSEQMTNCALFAKDVLKKPHLMLIDRLFLPITLLGLLIPALIGAAVTHSWRGAFDAMLWGGLVRIFLINQATWSVASLCHRYGKRPYDTGDFSGNIALVALVSFGAGWQNNHHAFPNSATTGLRWWQIDLTKWLINLLDVFGLVHSVRLPKPEQVRQRRIG